MNVIAINGDQRISVKSSRIIVYKRLKSFSELNVVSNHSKGSCVRKV